MNSTAHSSKWRFFLKEFLKIQIPIITQILLNRDFRKQFLRLWTSEHTINIISYCTFLIRISQSHTYYLLYVCANIKCHMSVSSHVPYISTSSLSRLKIHLVSSYKIVIILMMMMMPCQRHLISNGTDKIKH